MKTLSSGPVLVWCEVNIHILDLYNVLAITIYFDSSYLHVHGLFTVSLPYVVRYVSWCWSLVLSVRPWCGRRDRLLRALVPPLRAV